MPKVPLPVKLKIVAYLSLLSGIAAVIKFFVVLSHNTLYLPFDALGIPICFGLLHCRPTWRKLAIILIWIPLVMMPIIFCIGLFSPNMNTYYDLVGMQINIPSILFYAIIIAVYSLIIWEYRVLTNPAIKRLFNEPTYT